MRAKRLLNLVGDRLHTLPLVILYLTDGCNSRCIACDIWRNPRHNMAMNIIEPIVKACPELGIRWVLLSGGEATQHPRWAEAARMFRAQGVYVMLLTNGLMLRKQADEVRRSVDEVIVSLDAGTAETYRQIRGVDAFELVLEGIHAASQRGLPVVTRTTVQAANYSELPQIISTAKTAGASRISFLPVDTVSEVAFGPRFEQQGRLAGVNVGLSRDDVTRFAQVLKAVERRFAEDFASGLIAESPRKLRRMLRYFEGAYNSDLVVRPRCNAPHVSVVVEVDGTLRPCYFLPSWGKLETDQHIAEAVNDRGAQALRKAYRTGERIECERCVCPLYMGPRALLRLNREL